MSEHGDRAIGIIAILTIIATSVGVFFTFTLKKAKTERQARAAAIEQKAHAEARAEEEAQAAEEQAAASADAVRRKHLGSLVANLEARDLAAIEALFTTRDDPDQPRAAALILDSVVGELGYTPDLDSARPSAADGGTAADEIVYLLPVTRTTEDGQENAHDLSLGFGTASDGPPFSSLGLPSTLQKEVLAGATAKDTNATPASTQATSPSGETDGSAAGLVASRFVDAIVGQDYKTARAQCLAHKLPSEKVAALCFVFEDAQVTPGADTRVRMTAVTDTSAWAITRIHAPAWGEDLEFGMEIERRQPPGPGEEDAPEQWGISSINLSDLLSSYAARTVASEIPYTPIVRNPSGGESLALFFPYDSDEVHPRAQRQLQIIAQLLREDTGKKIRITGHTDALGTTGYNTQLSAGRAVRVRKFLVAAGIPDAQILTEAAGESAPLAPNEKTDGSDNPEGRARNRRAEIYLDF